ncbi:ribonuclease P protein component [Haoranjiania flava]|uniref:Ribonuclease P protein component n=1 Tax=Haoranjiania flava TaxID=1856322 RepID=A0AAE3LL12_9BACT|nr:ribonuclease P protein component [Haoranjiania flava]MCU7695532.1 ribonuclease P protein component [Haoranjiania flava]
MTATFTYGKAQKLKSRKDIETLFRSGCSFYVHPLKIFYRICMREPQESSPLKTGMGVSKKYFSKAVKRNRVKRLVREAYRLHKNNLYALMEARNLSADVFFIYTSREIIPFHVVEEKMQTALNILAEKIPDEEAI